MPTRQTCSLFLSSRPKVRTSKRRTMVIRMRSSKDSTALRASKAYMERKDSSSSMECSHNRVNLEHKDNMVCKGSRPSTA